MVRFKRSPETRLIEDFRCQFNVKTMPLSTRVASAAGSEFGSNISPFGI